jgi:uncharacterized protein (TIGR02611 family)
VTGEPVVGDADALKAAAARRAAQRGWREGVLGWRDGVRATRAGRLTLKIVVGTLGALLVVGGLIMVPFPGPGWLVVFAGLAVLATEFHWAHRLLAVGRRSLSVWTDWYKRQGWTVRIIVLAVTFATATAIVWTSVRIGFGIDLFVEGQKLLTRP